MHSPAHPVRSTISLTAVIATSSELAHPRGWWLVRLESQVRARWWIAAPSHPSKAPGGQRPARPLL